MLAKHVLYGLGLGDITRRCTGAVGIDVLHLLRLDAGIAQRHKLALVYGYPERGADGRVYNAAQWIDASGRRCLNYRKAYLFGELDRSQFAAEAQSALTFDFHGWKVGMLIAVIAPRCITMILMNRSPATAHSCGLPCNSWLMASSDSWRLVM